MRSLLKPSILVFASSLVIAVAGTQTPPASSFPKPPDSEVLLDSSNDNRSPDKTNTRGGDAKSMDTRARDVAEIKALEERFMTAFRAKDVNAIMQLCVPDDSLVVFDVRPPLEVKGSDAYRKDWEVHFSLFAGPLESDISEMDVAAGGDVAFVHYIHHVVGTMKDGKKADSTVRVTDCLKKVNGKWLIAHSHVSVPVDMRTGEGDTQPNPEGCERWFPSLF